jgi:hypothetical protein
VTRLARLTQLGLASLALCVAAPSMGAEPLPFGPGEQLTLRITYLHLLGGRATLSVLPAEHRGAPVMQFVAEARSQGFFAWLFRFRVAIWDPGPGCSLAIVKQLNEGRAHRDQRVSFDPTTGRAEVFDRKVEQRFFEVGPCALDVLSALFVARRRGFPEDDSMTLPLFDNGKRYELGLRFLGRDHRAAAAGGDRPVRQEGPAQDLVHRRRATGPGADPHQGGDRLGLGRPRVVHAAVRRAVRGATVRRGARPRPRFGGACWGQWAGHVSGATFPGART